MNVLNFLQYLRTLGKSYSVINTNKSMLMQTLKLMGNHWCDSPRFIPRFVKGLFNSIPPVPELILYWTYSRSPNGMGRSCRNSKRRNYLS